VDVAVGKALTLAIEQQLLQQQGKSSQQPVTAPAKSGKLHFGYLSSDLRSHVVGELMHAVLINHNRSALGVHCLSLPFPNLRPGNLFAPNSLSH
jgi:predicted O-linked N-acetylglucosamine transferase (SPINDLY family)